MPKQVTIKDYDGDDLRVDCTSNTRFYIDTRIGDSELGAGCVSLDRPAARAIILVLTEWLGADETHGLTPNIISFD